MQRSGSLWMRLFPALWMRWVVSIAVAVAVLAGLVAFVEHNKDYGSEAKGSKASLQQEAQEAEVVVGADQVPHTVSVRHGRSGEQTIATAVRADMLHRIQIGNVDGRLQHVTCQRAGARHGRVAYHCVAIAQSVRYPFVGVLSTTTHRVTYCKRDLPPIPSENIPVSPRCRL